MSAAVRFYFKSMQFYLLSSTIFNKSVNNITVIGFKSGYNCKHNITYLLSTVMKPFISCFLSSFLHCTRFVLGRSSVGMPQYHRLSGRCVLQEKTFRYMYQQIFQMIVILIFLYCANLLQPTEITTGRSSI